MKRKEVDSANAIVKGGSLNWPSDRIGRFRKLGEYWGAFLNASVRAEYMFLTQTIMLTKIDKPTFLRQSADPMLRVEIARLLAHELMHYRDHLGTVWGQELLTYQFEAVEVFMQGNEANFYQALGLARFLDRQLIPRYFTLQSDNWEESEPGLRWKAKTSAGLRFTGDGHLNEEDPIFMVTFESVESGATCRIPITPLTLLEVRAEYSEILAGIGYSKRVPADVNPLANKEMVDSINSRLYDPLSVEYLCCLHYTANQFSIKDPMVAYKLASSISGLALNLLPTHFDMIQLPQAFRAFGGREGAAKNRRDRGFAFMVLMENMVAQKLTADATLTEILNASGLPGEEDFFAQVNAWFVENGGGINQGHEPALRHLQGLRMQGIVEHTNGGTDGLGYLGRITAPPILLSDEQWIHAYESQDQIDSFENFIDTMSSIGRSMFEFRLACSTAESK